MPVWRVESRFPEDGVFAVKVGLNTRLVDREVAARRALHSLGILGERPTHGDHDNGSWMATPWYQGHTTAQLWAPLREQGLQRAVMRRRALGWAMDLAHEVAGFHSHRWVHGDVHPGQSVHTPAGVRLLDYASTHGPQGAIPTELLDRFPYTSCRVDTAAPEIAAAVVANRRPVATRAADVWALAATIRMCWTGMPPAPVRHGYGGRPPSVEQRWYAAANVRELARVPRSLAWPSLDAALAPALSPDPGDRPSAGDLHNALADLHRDTARAVDRSATGVCEAVTGA